MALSSAIYGDARHWDVHRPDHGAFLQNFGAGNAADRNATAVATLNLAARSPTVVAMIMDGDDDHIYVLHTMTRFPADPAAGVAHSCADCYSCGIYYHCIAVAE